MVVYVCSEMITHAFASFYNDGNVVQLVIARAENAVMNDAGGTGIGMAAAGP